MNRGEEVEEKLRRVRAWLGERGSPGVLIRQRSNFAWITAGGRSHVNTARDTGAATLVVTADRFVLLANNIESRRLVEEELVDVPLEVAEYAWHDSAGERTVLAAVGGANVVSDSDSSVASELMSLRAELVEPEIQRVIALGRDTSRIIEDVCRAIHPGDTEHGVAGRVHSAAADSGALVPVCLVAADQRISSRRHPLPTFERVTARAMVVVCIERHGLVCSATRIVSFAPLEQDLMRRHEAACRVSAEAAHATRVGRPIREILAEMVDAYARAGFADEWRHHHQGGSTGYQPRDIVANPGTDAVVQPNQLFAWNPSIAGTKAEDTMLAAPSGPKWVTSPGEEWPTISVEIEGRIERCADILISQQGR